MYDAINYVGLSADGQKYFDQTFRVLSGMYGFVTPTDHIYNYKFPIETK